MKKDIERYKNKGIFVKNGELAEILGVTVRAVEIMKKRGDLPQTKLLETADPKVQSVINKYASGMNLNGELLSNNKKKGNKTPKKQIKEEKPKETIEPIELNNIKEEELEHYSYLSLDELAEKYKKSLQHIKEEAIQKVIVQTLVNIEQYKKLNLETSKKKGDLVEKEQVSYFFNKYFNSMNEALIEMPSLDLSEKILGEIRMLEKRKSPKNIIKNILNVLVNTKEEDREQIIDNACIEIESKADEVEIKLKIQEMLQEAISKKIKQTYEAIKNSEYFNED